MLGTVLIVILILALFGGLAPFGAVSGRPYWGAGYGYGGGGIGLILIILLILVLLGRF